MIPVSHLYARTPSLVLLVLAGWMDVRQAEHMGRTVSRQSASATLSGIDQAIACRPLCCRQAVITDMTILVGRLHHVVDALYSCRTAWGEDEPTPSTFSIANTILQWSILEKENLMCKNSTILSFVIRYQLPFPRLRLSIFSRDLRTAGVKFLIDHVT